MTQAASTTAAEPFDFAPLLAAGLPAPAIKWNGFPKYNFVGGHNDAKQVPVDELIAAATAVLKREGKTLATYGLESGPLGYRRLREFLVEKLKRDAGISCAVDEILITSGSLQGIELVNDVLLSRGDTVLVEQVTYFGSLSRLARLGVNAIGVPLDDEGLRIDALSAALDDLKERGVQPKYIYTIPTVQNPTGARTGTSFTSVHFPNRSRRRCGSGTLLRTGRCCRACCRSRPTRARALSSRWFLPNIARRILPPMCRN